MAANEELKCLYKNEVTSENSFTILQSYNTNNLHAFFAKLLILISLKSVKDPSKGDFT